MEVIVLLIVLVVGGLYFYTHDCGPHARAPLEGRDHHPEHISGLDFSRMGRKPCMGSLVHRTGLAKLLASRVPGESGRPTARSASGPDTTSLTHKQERALMMTTLRFIAIIAVITLVTGACGQGVSGGRGKAHS